jgi:hypothetical protein
MRQIVFSLMLASLPLTLASGQTSSGAKPKSCALLTPEVVRKVSEASKKAGNVGEPSDLPLGSQGTACEWGPIILQVDPFPNAQIQQLPKSDPSSWETISGVGDAAYFHNVRNMIGELYVLVGKRSFALLIDIPAGSTAAAFKPTFITAANAIVPKLR